MRAPNEADQGALRVLMSAMSGMVALALLFFLAPFAGIGLLLAAIVVIPTLLWLRSRGVLPRRPATRRTPAKTFR